MPCANSNPARCIWRYGSNVTVGSLSAAPCRTIGKPARSEPSAGLIACRYQCGCWGSTPSAIFVVRYTVFDAGSYTGVDVEPRSGVRSPHPIVDDWNGAPNERCQRIEPVAALMPYAFAFSVVTTTVLPTTNGCE